MINVKISTVHFSDSTAVDIPASGVVLLVGPNNAGKSQTLRDLVGLSSQGGAYTGKAVLDIAIDKSGSQDDFREWTVQSLASITANGRQTYNVPGWGTVDPDSVSVQWMQPGLNVLAPIFMYHADATSRLTAGNSVASIDFSTSFAQHPIQKAYRDGQLEQEIDRISREAFGLGIAVDRYSGSVISLRVGEPPNIPTNGEFRRRSTFRGYKLCLDWRIRAMAFAVTWDSSCTYWAAFITSPWWTSPKPFYIRPRHVDSVKS
ncbi:hypothetical protein [Pseudarthrobacter siccitolerans]